MTERELRILKTVMDAIKQLTEEQQDRYLLVLQGAAAMADAMHQAQAS